MNQGCRYCYDHTTDPELTEENDFSSIQIGNSAQHILMFISTGGTRSPRIDVWQRFPSDQYTAENKMVGIYYPKYCPECGRKLREESDL